ncbi:MAG: cation transporter [Bdellovibrionales bacterium]|nr:cation transporter [Bdellovibrionales bacterium]
MKEKSLTLASILAATGASLCCIGPVVAAALGLGTFGAAGLFENLRPYLLGVTALLLGSAIFLRIRFQRKTACAGGECPPMPANGFMSKTLLFTSIAAVALLAAVPQLTTAYVGGRVGVDSTAQTAKDGVGQSVAIFKVDGMTCAACASGLKATLGREKGVVAAEVDYEKTTAKITFEPAKTSVEKLIAAIGQPGYVAKLKEGK